MGKFEDIWWIMEFAPLEVRLFWPKSRPFGLHPLFMHVIGNHNLDLYSISLYLSLDIK